MKNLAFTTSFLIIFSVNCQEMDNCHTDTLSNKMFCMENVTMLYYDEENNLFPGDFDSVTYDLYESDYLVVIHEGDEYPSEKIISSSISDIVTEKIKRPENAKVVEFDLDSQTKIENPDSIYRINWEELEAYVLNNKDSLKLDTLLMGSKVEYGYSFEWDVLKKCSFRQNLKHGEEISYYSIKELKGVTLTKNFRIKEKGKWKWGEKHGKWTHYNSIGEIIWIKKYNKGELRKEQFFQGNVY